MTVQVEMNAFQKEHARTITLSSESKVIEILKDFQIFDSIKLRFLVNPK